MYLIVYISTTFCPLCPTQPEAEPGSSRTTQEEEGDPSQGEASQGEASQGEASQGEASQGEVSQGEASQGEGSQGEPEVEEDPGETAAATTTTKKVCVCSLTDQQSVCQAF